MLDEPAGMRAIRRFVKGQPLRARLLLAGGDEDLEQHQIRASAADYQGEPLPMVEIQLQGRTERH